jgi:hypothetical protein
VGEHFRFDPVQHQYWVDGKEVLSVTQILKAAGLMPEEYYSDVAGLRGRQIHSLLQALDEGRLLEIPPESAWARYCHAYSCFLSQSRAKIIEVEKPRFSSAYRFAGTPDRLIDLGGNIAVLDIKTGGRCDWHRLQTAGYALLFNPGVSRFSLYLSANGQYSLAEHCSQKDFSVFLSALTVACWRRGMR